MNYDEITPGMDLVAFARRHRVRFARKDRSRLMRAIGWLLGLFGVDFMDGFWTTVNRTIYLPTSAPLPDPQAWPTRGASENARLDVRLLAYLERNRSVVEHEFHHVLQWERWLVLYSLSYLLLPVPVLFAWCRWYWERGPNLYQIQNYGKDVDRAVEVLWRAYAMPWPRCWMRRWFLVHR